MKKMVMLVLGLFLASVCYAEIVVEKVDASRVRVTKPVVSEVSLDQLKALSANLQRSIDRLTDQKAEYDKQIADAIALGVKTAAELKAAEIKEVE